MNKREESAGRFNLATELSSVLARVGRRACGQAASQVIYLAAIRLKNDLRRPRDRRFLARSKLPSVLIVSGLAVIHSRLFW